MLEEYKVIGIDIGGTKIHIGVVQDGRVIKELKLSTSAQAPEARIINELISGISAVMTPDVAGIGIGVPGLVDEKSGIVHNVLNIASWKEVHLKQNLESYFSKPVCITNDANAFIAGEKMYGKASAFNNVVGITLGTGFGTGIIIDGKLYSGNLSSAGEFGGIPYLDQTLEDYCSGKFFLNKFGMTGIKVRQLADSGDRQTLEILNEYGRHLGNAIKIILFSLSPEAVILGGSVCGSYAYFKDAMLASVNTFPFKQVKEQLVLGCSALDNAAVLGAAALFKMRTAETYVPNKAVA